jgi:hypothetical protein
VEYFVLRDNPELKIIILEKHFEIHDFKDKKRIFTFKEIDSLRIGKRVNYLVTFLSFIANFFIEVAGELYKERDQLKFNYDKKPVKISLKGCDLELAQKMVNNLNQKISQTK